MKNAVKIAVVSILVQAAMSAAAGAEEARPIAVDIRVEAGSGELSAKAAAISEALMDGDNAGADQLLADLYSGGVRKEEAAPVQAAHCCHCGQQTPAAVAVSTAAAPAPAPAAAAPADPFAKDPISQFVRAEEAKKAEADAKAKEKKEEADEKAKKQKAFNWGVSIMTIALLLLLIL
ncbi:MAG: hypothetical protein ACYC2I_02440 [Elusimicrobiales bacterium]